MIQRGTPFIPARLRALIRRHLSLKDYDYQRLRSENPYANKDEELFANSPAKIGIIEDISHYHKHYIAACSEMKISYQVYDLTSPDWLNKFSTSDCDAFLVWPSITNTTLKAMFDFRLRILEEDMGKILYPTAKECWLYENKPRILDWLNAHNIPHPKSWVFYDEKQAMEFADKINLPIVVKTATGASASGVEIVKSLKALRKLIKKYFTKGITPRGYSPYDRQWGFVYLQEYLPDVHEWRMVRIGKSFFGYRKEKGPDGLHSASHKWSFLDPGNNLLNLLKQVTDAGNFTSMDVDIFQTHDGSLFVNELQTVFGCTTPAIQMQVNNIPGRYLWENNQWVFQEGNFCNNHMCNLRIEYLCSLLSKNYSHNNHFLY